MSTHPVNSKYDPRISGGAHKVIYAHDLDGNFTFLNPIGEQISGYSCEEVRRMNIAEVVAPEFAARVREQVVSTATKMVGAVYEIEIIAKNGRRVALEVSTRVVLRHGERIEIEGIAVPSVMRTESSPNRLRCLDADFGFLS